MKNLIFEEIFILSNQEKKARRIKFDLDSTVILGDNNTGKSSLIKSIYYSMGAESYFSSEWNVENIIYLMKFKLNNTTYFLLRLNKLFGLFDGKLNLIRHAQSVTKIGEILTKEFFNFKVTLIPNYIEDNEVQHVIPPPAFQYLPYYLDQEKSWSRYPWNAFEKLTQFKKWTKDLIEYHVGIKPKEYYELSSQIDHIQKEYKKYHDDKELLMTMRNKVNEGDNTVDFNYNLDDYKKEIEQLLVVCNELSEKQESYKTELTKLNNQKIGIENHLKIAEISLMSLKKDYKARLDNIDEVSQCPTCGFECENSLIDRFSLLEDADECERLTILYNQKLIEVKEKIVNVEKKYLDNNSEKIKIDQFLKEKKGIIELGDIIKSEGKKEIRKFLADNIESCRVKIEESKNQQENLKKQRDSFLDRKRTKDIKEYYNSTIIDFLYRLNIRNYNNKDYLNIPAKLKSDGSDSPRALVAYFYSILKTILEYSSNDSYFFPIVIDSPNQQDQDDANRLKLFEFILEQKPKNTQLILGTVELYGASYNGYKIALDKKHQFLRAEEFEEVQEFINPLMHLTLKSLNDQYEAS